MSAFNNKFASFPGTHSSSSSELSRSTKHGRAPGSLQSSSPPSSSDSQQLPSTLSPSSLSTEECSSRYSSLQDTESLKSAILDSFRMHWIQAWSIMEQKILHDITMDDMNSIVNHIEQMISLLVEEMNASDIRTINSFGDSSGKCSSEQNCSYESTSTSQPGHPEATTSLSPLLDFLFVESILEKVFQWSEMSGEWKYTMYLEQLKLYELLVSQLCQADLILVQPPFLQPLLHLLDALFISSNGNFMLIEIEKRLILLLNTLCVALSQNTRLLEVLLVYGNESSRGSNGNGSTSSTAAQFKPLHFAATHNGNSSSSPHLQPLPSSCDSQSDRHRPFSFPVFLLLIQFVHREGPIGQQSKDALLLCLALSRHDDRLAYYIVNQTDFCPLLATGLSGLFSSLPRVVIGQSMSAEQFQFKDDLLHNSKEIEQFLKCLDFCNAVAQISHPIIQVQLLNYIYNGFLVSVIGPALHQDVANVSIEDLESMPTYSNTLDEIITATAYLELFLKTISEPNLIRIFLEFLCFEQYDNRCIVNSLITRISAKSKLSLISLILFKTLLDLNCEDFQFELIFKYLLRGKHLSEPNSQTEEALVNGTSTKSTKTDTTKGIEEAMSSYQQNWLAVSGQKLFTNSLSNYLHSLCPQQAHPDLGESPLASCECHSKYLANYLDYLNDARYAIEQSRNSTRLWRNVYMQPCSQLTGIHEHNLIFCAVDGNLNNNDEGADALSTEENSRAINEYVIESSGHKKGSDRASSEKEMEPRNGDPFEGATFPDDQLFSSPVVGAFLETVLNRVALFFENDVLTNLHLTGLLTALSQSPHKLLLSLFFDETLARSRGVPCLLHCLQSLSLEAQSFCDEIPNFESMFQSAKINLQSVPIGELNCQLVTGNHHQSKTRSYSTSQMTKSKTIEASLNKGFGALKSFFGSSGKSKASSLIRRDSNASINSYSSAVLEAIPGGMRFSKPKELPPPPNNNMDKMTELIYNLIIFDEFLMEMSAILIEQSIGGFIQ